MEIIRGTDELRERLAAGRCGPGCLADTGFLYAASYMDDRVHQKAVEAFDLLAEFEVRIYANVISRMEFVDLVLRKQITLGAIQTFERMNAKSAHATLFKLLKNIRDENVAHRRKGPSYKISESTLKKLRKEMEAAAGSKGWSVFCASYLGEILLKEWEILEEELGLRFVEALDGRTSEVIDHPLLWADMVQLMGHKGIRGPDAMIVNFFLKSRLPMLVTTDSDIVGLFEVDDLTCADKTILHLD